MKIASIYPLMIVFSGAVCVSSVSSASSAESSNAPILPVPPQRLGHLMMPPPPPLGPGKVARLKHILLVRDLLINKYDSNGDGVLDAKEKAILLQDAQNERQKAKGRLMKRFDLDHDGKLSKEERQKMRETMHMMRSPMHPGPVMMPPMHPMPSPSAPPPPMSPMSPKGAPDLPPPPQLVVENAKKEKFVIRPSVFMLAHSLLLAKYDANQDGVIDREEMLVIRKDADALYTQKVDQMLAQYDKDGNGVLSAEEKQGVCNQHDDQERDDGEEMDDIDLFIQESFDTELIESMEEGLSLKES
ncbi:MAG: EF-hand domain-containing protein [Akkermansia sp.]